MPVRQVDPINVLRETIMKKQAIKCKEDCLYFPNKLILRLGTKTAWQSSDTGEVYSLGDIWLYLDSRLGNSDDKAYFTKLAQMKKKHDLKIITASDRGKLIRKRGSVLYWENREREQYKGGSQRAYQYRVSYTKEKVCG